MEVGDKVVAMWTESFTDNVTKGKSYEVIQVEQIGFWIINDKGERCFPISVPFRKSEK